MIRFGSVCSGIEAASVAWEPLGWKAAWLSEIEPFPCAVLAHHYPEVPNLGDMTTLPDRIASGEINAPDVFCGGTPCQAFSVAGLRKSLDDARGNLSLTFCEIANAIDDVRRSRGEHPCVIFWENVPGVLNTKDNAFGCFLAELAGEDVPLVPAGDKWTNAGCVFGPKRTVAWRVLDAQYFGVAQRRRRVFVVASVREWFDPAAVLFEFDGVRRDTAPSREAGQEAAKCLTRGACQRLDYETEDFVTYGIPGNWIGRAPENGGNVVEPMHDVAPCLTKTDQHGVAHPMPINTMVALRHNALGEGTGFGIGEPGDPAYTMTKGHSHAVYHDMAVRRLTPVECERLQGFPDNYTNIPWRKADQSPDGPRYKALGNSWAVPNVRWIGRRINDQLRAPSGAILEPLEK